MVKIFTVIFSGTCFTEEIYYVLVLEDGQEYLTIFIIFSHFEKQSKKMARLVSDLSLVYL